MFIRPDRIILDYFYEWESTTPQAVFLKQPFGDSFKDFTWQEVGQQARRLATFLQSQGLPPHSNIGLVSKNCAEWIIADLAIQLSGHVSVPFYPTLTGDQLRQVLNHSECQLLFVGKLDDWAAMKPGISPHITCVSFPTYNPDPSHVQWESILQQYEPLRGNALPPLSTVYTIIYTSGTTGNPKGVMVTHKALAEGIYATQQAGRFDLRNTRFFSYLPLCHIAERNIVECAAIITGGTIYFAETLETFAANLQRARPTHFLAVPRIWAKFQEGILGKMSQSTLNILLKIPFINSAIRKKIKAGLGLDAAVVMLTGAAPMPVPLHQWYKRLHIDIQEAYGMTENLGAVSVTPATNPKSGSVGLPYPGMEIKFDSTTGELLTRSPWHMVGYYKEPALTAEALDADGWLHTGDVAELDADGFLQITGRSKEMFKTSKGEYIAPSQIEMMYSDYPFIEHICVVGNSLPQPIALVILNEHGKQLDKTQVTTALTEAKARINARLKTYERLHKLVILPESWTVDNNKITPTLKLKRNVIEKEYAPKLMGWYEQDASVFWA